MKAHEPRGLHKSWKIQLSEKLRDLIMLCVTPPNITGPVKLFLITDDICEITNMCFK